MPAVLTPPPLTMAIPVFRLTFQQLCNDLLQAYRDAADGKSKRGYVVVFERQRDKRLYDLAAELWQRTYTPAGATCFIIRDPKQREVFAADFRDRIVHHLYYNYVHSMFERSFVADSYSCIEGRGTHYGIKRLQSHISSVSQGYSQPCYVLKIDIRGYFMHIDRQRLLAICERRLTHMSQRRIGGGDSRRWRDVVDMDFILYLTRVFTLYDPLLSCRIAGTADDWQGLPPDKSLFSSPKGCGLPIGNLTSQLYSNVYLGEFDDFCKRQLHCRHYGRYVDDAYVVSHDRKWLLSLVPQVRDFLNTHLALSLHERKLQVADAMHGVLFLGAYIKPHRIYVSNATLHRMNRKIDALEHECKSIARKDPSRFMRRRIALRLQASLNSYLGVLGHFAAYNIAVRLLGCRFASWGYVSFDGHRFVPYGDIVR